jgi:hypothetical protein
MAEQLYRCSKCKEEKPVEYFSKRKTHGPNEKPVHSHCKKCNAEHQKTPAGRASKTKYKQSEKFLLNKRKYEKTSPFIREYRSRKAKERNIRFPEKRIANNALTCKIRHGKIVRPTTCSMADDSCGGRIEAHHHDYGKPYDVVWVCQHHHRAIHNQLSNVERREAEMAAMDRQEAGEGGGK